MRKYFAAFLALSWLCAKPVDASSIDTLKITGIMVSNTGTAFITLEDGPQSTIPECGAAYPKRFVIGASTAAGQSQLSGAMLAYSSHIPVTIVGLNSCNIVGNTETMQYLWVGEK